LCVQMPWEDGDEEDGVADKVAHTARLSAKTRGAVKQALMQRQKQLASGSNKLAAELFDWESKKHGAKH
jgi:hypothetical protein